jgi:hypothetical protein
MRATTTANGMDRACSRPAGDECWQGAPKTREHAMSQKLETLPAVVGIDIGKNSFLICWPESAWCHRAAAKMVTWPGGGPIR